MIGILSLFSGRHFFRTPTRERRSEPSAAKAPMTHTLYQAPQSVQAPQPVQDFAPGTRIRYDDQLVPRLKDDHTVLVNIFNEMVDNAQHANYDALHKNLDDFRHLFNAHLLTENTKLYIFLDRALKPDDANYEIIQEFRREMNDIGKAVRQFLLKWGQTAFDAPQAAHFLEEAAAVGSVLVRRIETEERRLYEIYQMLPDMLD